MSSTLKTEVICTGIWLLLYSPLAVQARNSSLTAGLSTTMDYNERSYDHSSERAGQAGEDDDYHKLYLSPMFQIISSSRLDSITFEFTPNIKYDFIAEDTEWDGSFQFSADRSLTQSWTIALSNHFIQTDHYLASADHNRIDQNGVTAASESSSSAELSSDRGRKRYWKNSTHFGTHYRYRQKSLTRLSGDWEALRNDNEDRKDGDADYDRYVISFTNEHHFSQRWQTTLKCTYVRGDYKKNREPGNENSNEPSDDLREYLAHFTVTNRSIQNNPITVTYDYSGVQYDDPLGSDGSIHHLQLSWRKEISSHLHTILGGGPSCRKTDGLAAVWDANGIAQVDYQTKRLSWRLKLDKVSELDNFSGTAERGSVNIRRAATSARYRLSKDFDITTSLDYIHKEHEKVTIGSRTHDSSVATEQTNSEREAYAKEQYSAEMALSYRLLKDCTAQIIYRFTHNNSEKDKEDYDDHRLLFTISWQQDLLRW
ncbi:MAG: hypothetical protein CSA26_06630 [Desulfobacterales bacterium]|nr:MAG: hypothetical protein CSA26_06630 [Desulfobacterales bacterium]